ncbi:PIR Superfamily Protein [Plasmodium ovale curtisi]|uniref:PIR Superfamily Protein n=1 Tax=Plasmodium ovale curtisi TaxID=864141 RepID=A0A1A8X571_PLAOA|nr:PIR Superfamily Protein [Plasmodium ovale curtisi]
MSDVSLDETLLGLLDGISGSPSLNEYYESLSVAYNNGVTTEEFWHIYEKYKGIDPRKSCKYLNYWFLGKLKGDDFSENDIDPLCLSWKAFVKNKRKENTCDCMIYNKFNKDELKTKKKLFDFFEYYYSIKSKLGNNTTKKKDDYCKYIKEIFDIYKKVDKENNTKESVSYREEILLFRKLYNNCELIFLEKKCRNLCLHSVYYKRDKNSCPSNKKPPEKDDEKESTLSNTRELFTLNENTGIVDKKENGEDKLPAYKVYDKLNNTENKDDYCNDCNDILFLEEDYPGINDLCKMMAKNLRKLHELIENEDNSERCSYFKHWLYNEVGKIFKYKWKDIHASLDSAKLMKVGYNIIYELNYINSCFYNFDCSFEECKEMKILYNYFKNFDSINCDKNSDNEKCIQTFCNDVTYINNLYDKNIEKCCTCYNYPKPSCENNCEDYFKCEEKYNSNNLYLSLKCKEKTGKDLTKLVKFKIIDQNVIFLTKKSQEKTESRYTIEISSVSTSENTNNTLKYDPFYSIVLFLFSIIGIFLLFFIFYKFTPFGSFFHNKILRKKKTKYNLYEEDRRQLIIKNSNYENGNSRNRRMQLAYHTV